MINIEILKLKFVNFSSTLINRLANDGEYLFYPERYFEWTKILEDRHPIIKKELIDLLSSKEYIPALHEVSTTESRISKDGKWRSFFFYVFEKKISGNCSLCPETTKIIESIPQMKSAMFSILKGKTHIPPHKGPYSGFIRCLLGLKIPSNKELCKMRLVNEFRSWEEGSSLNFVDSREHEIWNNSNELRAVLLIDFVRPLHFPLSILNWLGMKTFFSMKFNKQFEYNLRKKGKLT